MIMMDLLSTNKTLGRYLALVALFALLPSLLILNVPWMTVYAGVLIAYAAVLGAQMTDERNGWERFRQALPLTRAQVVAGRAAFVAIGAFVGTALGVFVYLGACAVRQLPAFAAMTGAGAPDLPQLALSVAFALACSLVMAGIVLMLTARFGLTKAIRFLPGAFLALLLLFPQILNAVVGQGNTFSTLLKGASTMPDAYLVAGITAAGACAFYLAASAVAAKLYARRDL